MISSGMQLDDSGKAILMQSKRGQIPLMLIAKIQAFVRSDGLILGSPQICCIAKPKHLALFRTVQVPVL
jgi:hypothetical protein